MKPAKFLESRVKRQIQWNGVEYEFTKMGEDNYRQPIETDNKIKVTGIYHEENSYVSKTGSDSSVTVTEPSPKILCLWSDASKLSGGDILLLNDKKYKITGITDIQNYRVAGDISLELVQ